MKQRDPKALYEEPITTVTQVVLEGFICTSVRLSVEVDELVNKNMEDGPEVFNYDF